MSLPVINALCSCWAVSHKHSEAKFIIDWHTWSSNALIKLLTALWDAQQKRKRSFSRQSKAECDRKKKCFLSLSLFFFFLQPCDSEVKIKRETVPFELRLQPQIGRAAESEHTWVTVQRSMQRQWGEGRGGRKSQEVLAGVCVTYSTSWQLPWQHGPIVYYIIAGFWSRFWHGTVCQIIIVPSVRKVETDQCWSQ